MYADPSLIREHVVKVRFNDLEADLVNAWINYILDFFRPLASGGTPARRSARRSDEIAIPCFAAAALTVCPRSTRRRARQTACD